MALYSCDEKLIVWNRVEKLDPYMTCEKKKIGSWLWFQKKLGSDLREKKNRIKPSRKTSYGLYPWKTSRVRVSLSVFIIQIILNVLLIMPNDITKVFTYDITFFSIRMKLKIKNKIPLIVQYFPISSNDDSEQLEHFSPSFFFNIIKCKNILKHFR